MKNAKFDPVTFWSSKHWYIHKVENIHIRFQFNVLFTSV